MGFGRILWMISLLLHGWSWYTAGTQILNKWKKRWVNGYRDCTIYPDWMNMLINIFRPDEDFFRRSNFPVVQRHHSTLSWWGVTRSSWGLEHGEWRWHGPILKSGVSQLIICEEQLTQHFKWGVTVGNRNEDGIKRVHSWAGHLITGSFGARGFPADMEFCNPEGPGWACCCCLTHTLLEPPAGSISPMAGDGQSRNTPASQFRTQKLGNQSSSITC